MAAEDVQMFKLILRDWWNHLKLALYHTGQFLAGCILVPFCFLIWVATETYLAISIRFNPMTDQRKQTSGSTWEPPTWKDFGGSLKSMAAILVIGGFATYLAFNPKMRDKADSFPADQIVEMKAALTQRPLWEVRLRDAIDDVEPYLHCAKAEKCMLSMDDHRQAEMALKKFTKAVEEIPPNVAEDQIPADILEKMKLIEDM